MTLTGFKTANEFLFFFKQQNIKHNVYPIQIATFSQLFYSSFINSLSRMRRIIVVVRLTVSYSHWRLSLVAARPLFVPSGQTLLLVLAFFCFQNDFSSIKLNRIIIHAS